MSMHVCVQAIAPLDDLTSQPRRTVFCSYAFLLSFTFLLIVRFFLLYPDLKQIYFLLSHLSNILFPPPDLSAFPLAFRFSHTSATTNNILYIPPCCSTLSTVLLTLAVENLSSCC